VAEQAQSWEEQFLQDGPFQRRAEHLHGVLQELDSLLTESAALSRLQDDRGRQWPGYIHLRAAPWASALKLQWTIKAAAKLIEDQQAALETLASKKS
jgi:hypothetical protein